MKANYLLFAFILLLVAACNTDVILESRFAGKYDVTLHAPDSQKDLKKAKKDIEKDIKKAQKEIEKGVDEAKDQIERELGQGSPVGDALQNFIEGVGKMAEGLADLGEGLGTLGLEMGEGVLKNVRFKAEFKKNGELLFGKGRSDNVKYWNIQNGILYVWEYEDEKMKFEIKQKGANQWELIGEKVTFYLTKSE
jgi:hypothetical protein